ncbi:MAG TPA: hypothetical protein PKB02_14465 [Anaerohalosphaeraceae bacterium]|nr:hypothetical protein [Anaerohalosphaeraceae bacterium]
MKKIHIILLLAAGLLSFGSAFGVSFWLKKSRPVPADQAAAQNNTSGQPSGNSSENSILESLMARSQTADDLGMSETQLKNLIFDIRQKMQEYNDKQKTLEQEKQQIEITRQTLQEEIEQLNQLQEKLNLTLISLKDKEKAIQNSVVEIETIERTNFQRIAGTYDKMDPAQAGKILATMVTNNQMPDAVKILYYMNERSAGKLLGEVGTNAPEVAAALSLQLKRIREQK